jgi:hypothetical protein
LRADREGTDLLGRHILWRTDHCICLSLVFKIGIAEILGNTEISQIGIYIFIEQNISRFQIAMDHSDSVRSIQCKADLLKQVRGGIHWQRTLFQ